jgi:hypothetical protein
LNATIDVHIHYSFEEDGEGTAVKQYAEAHAGEGVTHAGSVRYYLLFRCEQAGLEDSCCCRGAMSGVSSLSNRPVEGPDTGGGGMRGQG